MRPSDLHSMERGVPWLNPSRSNRFDSIHSRAFSRLRPKGWMVIRVKLRLPEVELNQFAPCRQLPQIMFIEQ